MTQILSNQIHTKTSEHLLKLKEHKGDKIKVGEIIEGFHDAGFAILIIIFSIPVALPLPAVGVASILAIPVVILCAQLAVGRKSPWLPSKIANKEISMSFLNKAVDKAIPYFEKIEMLLKPRLSIFSGILGEKIIGTACLICSISVLMPLPFSNTVPSMGIVAMAIGLIERDGIIIIGGMMIGALGISLTVLIFIVGKEVFDRFVEYSKSYVTDYMEYIHFLYSYI